MKTKKKKRAAAQKNICLILAAISSLGTAACGNSVTVTGSDAVVYDCPSGSGKQ